LIPFVEEVKEAGCKIVVVLAVPMYGGLAVDAFIKAGVKRGGFVFVSDYWLDTALLTRPERFEVTFGGI
jgi:hypothetical protein